MGSSGCEPADGASRLSRRAFLAGAAATPVALGGCTDDDDPPRRAAPTTEATGAGRTTTAAVAPLPTGTASIPGLAADGRADDTAALRAVVDRFRPDQGVAGDRLALPPGVIRITDTIDLVRWSGALSGNGLGHPPSRGGTGTVLLWDGPADRPMLRVRDSKAVRIADLRFEGHDDRPPSAGIEFRGEAADQQGTNAQLVVDGCHFGAWPWAEAGAGRGRIDTGIAFAGDNTNNDQFALIRCSFAGGGGAGTVGVRIGSTQSVWGQLTDCLFDHLEEGLHTLASTVVFNGQFDRCGTDVVVVSTAQLDVVEGSSERSGRLARVGPEAALRWSGGSFQADPDHLTGALIDAFPSESATVVLRDLRLTWPGGADPDAFRSGRRPAIRFGPDEATKASAGGPGFLVKVVDCRGVYADQFDLAGRMWATVPVSRGSVEVTSRTADGVVAFRNELWAPAADHGRTELDTEVWDPPRPGSW